MRDAGRTIFVVTHQPALLEGVADEFVGWAQGRIAGWRRTRGPAQLRLAAYAVPTTLEPR